MAKWTGYFKIVSPESTAMVQVTDSQTIDGSTYGNYTWFQRLVQGQGARLARYHEYDIMDRDVEVTRAVDIIAEEMTGNNTKTGLPLNIVFQAEEKEKISETVVLTLRAAVRHWSETHDWHNRLFHIARATVKYGDVFFRKTNEFSKWKHIPAKSVVGAIVDQDDVTKIYGWIIRTELLKTTNIQQGGYTASQTQQTESIPAKDIVRFTLNDDMSDTAPFGESILLPVHRAHKQKELLEDAIIIYRIQRAPERRVFYIDVGKMPPHRTKQYLEQIKNELRQKKIPVFVGGTGKDTIDSVYNPQSMSEDYFFSVRSEGRGSRVETLPGGQGLGELADLEHFMDKVFRGLRVPTSYMKSGSDNAIFNDGRVGTAYIEELRFALYVARLQGRVEVTLDTEFKTYLRAVGINIDPTLFVIRLPEPSNFGKYRQQELDAALLNAYTQADGIPHLSKRFGLSRFLQLTRDEIATNEALLREEKGVKIGEQDMVQRLYNAEYATEAAAGALGGLGPELGGGELPALPEEGGLGPEGGISPEGAEAGPAPPGEAKPPAGPPPIKQP